jgi:hypothetical protein
MAPLALPSIHVAEQDGHCMLQWPRSAWLGCCLLQVKHGKAFVKRAGMRRGRGRGRRGRGRGRGKSVDPLMSFRDF